MQPSQRSGHGNRERAWKLVSKLVPLLAAMVAKRVMRTAYRSIRKDAIRKNEAPATPFDPSDSRFSWPDALLWAAAAGVGLGVSKAVSARLAAFGWEAATGAPPPTQEENPATT